MDDTIPPVSAAEPMEASPLQPPASQITPLSSTTAPHSVTPSMPAPKVQAPQRPRRVPVVDPSTLVPTRRSSTRSIKRKKFDDELVESSLIKTERARPVKGGEKVAATSSASTGQSHGVHITTPAPGLAADTDIASSGVTSGGGTGVGEGAPFVGAVKDLVSSASAASPRQLLASAASEVTTATTGGAHTLNTSTRLGKGESGNTRSSVSTASQPLSKPSSEKKSRLSAVKSSTTTAAAKGVGASGKNVASKQPSIASKSGGSKVTGSKATTVSKSKSKSKSKKSSRKQKDAPALKDLGRWKPQDDLALITAVQQTNDLNAVYTGVKFSCRFTLKEIKERWYALLYDPVISKTAMEAARQLHQDTVATIQGKALYSNAEEKLLGTIGSTSQPTQETFQGLLHQHPDVFHPARTAKTLLCHWLLMKQYHLLPDQTVQPMPRGDHILNLSDIEDFVNDDDISDKEDAMVEKEMAQVDRRNKREIRHLEQELPKWQVMVDSVTGISMPDFDSQTLGVLRGRLVRYLMRSKEISLGRTTKDNHVDVDLSLEGPAWKVSRRQGIIKLRNSGDFFIANEGKRPIIVDGKPVLCGNKQKLNNNSVIEISCLRFTFLINQDVINAVRADVPKPGIINTPTAAT